MRFARNSILALLLLAASSAAAQGCAMCSSGAEAAGKEQRRALFRGVLVLLVPTMVILGGIGVAGYRMRHPAVPGDEPPSPPAV